MSDPTSLQKQIREEVYASIDLWKDIIVDELGDKIEFMFSKGSCTKKWDSIIDYVPLVSDVDIHMYMKTYEDAKQVESDLSLAMKVSSKYAKEFSDAYPDALHLPRIQFLVLNEFANHPLYCPPKPEQVHQMVGKCPRKRQPLPDKIREIDKTNTLEEASFLQKLPNMIIDRTGLELWTLLRRFTYRISPAPVRVITQTHKDPAEVWTWNRTKIVEYLIENDMQVIAKEYSRFYELGWELFQNNFEGMERYHEMFSAGTRVLSYSIACMTDSE
ncbi:MAG: hypothetical protein GF411_10675 [Candidatus Lokiarchaeota archaeon]|nr:hypothetical protein [Candidatus Lokiarchaeota archaeon]